MRQGTTYTGSRIGLRRRTLRAGSTLLATSAVLLFVMSGCGSDESADNGASNSVDVPLSGTNWTLASVTVAGKSVEAVKPASLKFNADGKTLAGSTGCNGFTGTYEQTGADLKVTLGPMTLVACADAATTAQEAAITAGLPKVASFAAGEQLVLKDSSGATLLTYGQALSTLVGTSWKATGVNNGKGGVESTTATETITATFGQDGALSGFAGCNNYNGTYEEKGPDGVTISNVATTRKACEDALMTLETQYITALGNVATYEISGETLTLRDSSGSTQATYALAS